MIFDYLFAAIPLLGTLIFVHELGHFLAAKACKVRVLKFSLGFGSPIGIGRFRMRWVRGGTEYVVAWFPLGGFVKMLGEPMPGDVAEPVVLDARPDEYLSAKPMWQKLFITFAGPAMNLVLPVLAYMFVLWVGIPHPTSLVGMVERGSPAALAGLQAGDRLVAVDGAPVEWWRDAVEQIATAPGERVQLVVDRDGEERALEVPVEARDTVDAFGAVERTGWIGIGNRRLPALIGVPDTGSAATAAGLLSGDRITGVGDTPVEDWEALRRAYEAQPAKGEVLLALKRRSEWSAGPNEELPEPEETTLAVPALGSLDALGLIPATVLVSQIDLEMPAGQAGLRPGDLLLTVDGRPIGSFAFFANTVLSSQGRALEITYARAGETSTVSVAPRLVEVENPLGIRGMTHEVYRVGLAHAAQTLEGEVGLEQIRNPLASAPRAVSMTAQGTLAILGILGKLVSGEVGTDQIAGPIGIAEVARATLDRGWRDYLAAMVGISINLAIVNLLPIPILDGGQALIYLVEGVKRSPISVRTREMVQQTGLLAIVMLMALAFWNDLSRHWSQFVEWISTAL